LNDRRRVARFSCVPFARRLIMQTGTRTLTTGATWAEALFASALQRSDRPSDEDVRHAVIAAVHSLGVRGCAERVAQEFGDHPETAATRMRWALAVSGEHSADQLRQLADEQAVRKPAPGSILRIA
jgi:hypothetical protein